MMSSRLALIIYITCICRLQETIRDIKQKQHQKRLLGLAWKQTLDILSNVGDCTSQKLLAISVEGIWDENGFKAQIAMKSSLSN
jgi:hypothetical protein